MDERHGLNLLLAQYRNSPNLIKYISILLTEFSELELVFQAIILGRQFNTAVGFQLDCIAELVGTSRTIYGANALGYFGYYDNAQSYGINVGRFRGKDDKETGDLILSDEQLKARIKARVIKTMGNLCIEDILEYCDLLLGRSLDIEITEGTASLHIRYHGVLSMYDKALLANVLYDIKVVGVAYTLEDDDGDIEVQIVSIDYPAEV